MMIMLIIRCDLRHMRSRMMVVLRMILLLLSQRYRRVLLMLLLWLSPMTTTMWMMDRCWRLIGSSWRLLLLSSVTCSYLHIHRRRRRHRIGGRPRR